VSANQADAYKRVSVRAMCRVLGVSHSGYYDWRDRAPSQRAVGNAVLTERIRDIHKASDETYGMPRVRAQLRNDGERVSRKRIARLMRSARISGVSRRRGFTVTTERNPRQRHAPDLVNRQFRAAAPDQLWVADMTYLPTWTGFVYLAIVIDAFSRKVVGWSMSEQMNTELGLPPATRRPLRPPSRSSSRSRSAPRTVASLLAEATAHPANASLLARQLLHPPCGSPHKHLHD
jgi:putative transposase